MPVRKREFKNGVKWAVDVKLPNGKRYRKVIGTKKQAEKVQRKIESEIVEGKWYVRDAQDVPFSQLADEYLEYVEPNKAKGTYTVSKYRVGTHLLSYFGDTPISQITPQMVDNYKSMRLRDGMAPSSVNEELARLSHMMTMAIHWRYIDKNVVSKVERFKVPEKSPRFLNQEEIGRLVKAAKISYIYPLIVTALNTGMRKSELFNLKWSDIDFDQHTVTVQSKGDWNTKNYKSRTIQLTPVLEETLKEHRKLHLKLGIQSEYVFTYQEERIRDNTTVSLKKVLNAAELEGVTLHRLRHTFASHLAMAGVSLMDVKELIGHQNFETTLQYAHLAKDHVKK